MSTMIVHLRSWLLALCLLIISVHALPTPIDAITESSVADASRTIAPSAPSVKPRQVAFTGEILTTTEGYFIFVSTRSVTASTTVTSVSTVYDVETQFTTFTAAGDTSTVTTTTTTTVPAAAARASIPPRRPGVLADTRNERTGRLVYPRQATTITTYTSTRFVNGYTTVTLTSTLATVTSTDLDLVTSVSTRVETVLDTARPLQFVTKTEVVTLTAERPTESATPSITAAGTVAETSTSIPPDTTTVTTPSSTAAATTVPEGISSATTEATSSTRPSSSEIASSTQPAAGTTTSAAAPTTTIIITTGQGQAASEPSSGGLSREAQIGIGVGVGALMVVITLLGVACLIHRRKNRDQDSRGVPSDTSAEMQISSAGVAAYPTTSFSRGAKRPELYGQSRSELHGETATKSGRVWSGESWSTVAAGGYASAATDDERQYSTHDGQWYPAVHGEASPPPDENGFVAHEGGRYWHNRHGWQKGPAELHHRPEPSELDAKSYRSVALY